MLRSLYAGVSGMKGFQTKLDTIGNNIANVNTTGFKKGRVSFQDMMSQSVKPAEGPNPDTGRGGLNPSQVGLGSKIGSIDTIHTQGNNQTTNRALDVALEGDGMFVLAEGGVTYDANDNPTNFTFGNSSLSFTRAGNFYLDNSGAIVNNSGKYVVGEGGIITIPENAQSFSILSDGTVSYVDENQEVQEAGRIALASFSNPGGLEKIGGNEYRMTDNAGFISSNNNDFVLNDLNDLSVAGQNGTGQMVSGSLEMSNVDLADEFTEMITAQRGFQANTKIITTSDEILQELVNLKR
ncbi:flagellar basal body rod protein FlgG [Bacillus sp. SB49]|uniref:flagellar basal body rod protein FlgG n=1 Tax=Bacillaceae TaxID=186817 RepID=UPI0002A503AC|nr:MULTISPECIES: flagellar basal body rod protein FlgG [Bacillaceae]ELK44747.1 flagellar basal body rod protein FlgG [Halobacillus sp. BAB-2008]QHT46662.1 flagellar basal body rod protein FlgG [Bacillus sp. SB49]